VAVPGVPEGLTEREAEVYRLTVVNQLTQSKIAARLGTTQQAVSEILASARAKLPPVDLDGIRRQSLELHLDTLRAALELAEMPGAPVTAGKDGDLVLDPATGEYVRDYTLRLAAREAARKADAEIRKLYGLDAATKTEVSGSVKYEVAGVDISKLS
jgi:transcriptional regulator with XRE-family HTH domain